MGGLREFVVKFGTEKRCIEHLAGLRWSGGFAWFLAAYLMGPDKRGISAKFLQRELGVAYQTAWTMAHKLRQGLSEDPSRPLHEFLGSGRDVHRRPRDPTSPGRSTANPDKSLVVAAVEKMPAPKNWSGKYRHVVKREHGFFAENARIVVLPAATRTELGAFLKANLATNSPLLTDGFAGYRSGGADLAEYLKHTPVIQDDSAIHPRLAPD